MDIYLQILWNSIVFSALYAPMIVSFTLLYSVTRILHVAHGAVMLFGGYLFYTGLVHGLGLPLSILLGVVGSAVLGFAINALVYERLRARRRLTSTAGMLISVACLLVLQNVFLLIWSSHTLVTHTVIETLPPVVWGPFVMTPLSLIILSVSIPILIAITLVLKKTRLGRAVRAVSDQEEMAEVVGVNAKRIRAISFLLLSAVAGASGVLGALYFTLDPSRAVSYSVDSFSYAIVGGLGSVPGAIVATVSLVFLTNLGGFWVTAGIKTLFVFLVTFCFLIFRPQGLFGKKPL